MSRSVKCPTCRKETAWDGNLHRPFCSERCRLVDLGAWVEGRYRIPGDEIDSNPGGDDEDKDKQLN